MEYLKPDDLLTHLLRFVIIILSVLFVIFLGRFRPEWKSRKTVISWIWTMVAIDIIIMDRQLAMTLTAQFFIGGALILNVINFIGDRIETIKFKDFSASLGHEETNEKGHSINKATKEQTSITGNQIQNQGKSLEPIPIEQWPDGGSIKDPGPEQA